MSWLQHVPSATRYCPSKQHAPQISGELAAGLHVWECPDCKLRTVVSIDNAPAVAETSTLPIPPLMPSAPRQPIPIPSITTVPTPPKRPYNPEFDVNNDLLED